MRLLRKLLDNLGDVWNTMPKDTPYLSIAKGTGLHTMLTIDDGSLYLHSVPYRREMPQRQVLVLDGMTTSEVIATMTGMGYIVTPSADLIKAGVNSRMPYVMMEVENARIDTKPFVTTAFQSNLWARMYPIYRILRRVDFDTEQALKQLNRTMADGTWLDFWASFFSITREPGETDNNFIRRFTMWLFNPKTNNIALKELLAYRLQDTNINIADRGPLQFALEVGTKYLQPETAAALHKILREAKGAGIEYFLNYMADPNFEDYPAWLADQTGKPFSSLDVGTPKLQKTLTESKPIPTESKTGGAQRLIAETVPLPSETPGGAHVKTLAETILTSLEAKAAALQATYVEGPYYTPQVQTAPTFTRASEAYLPDGSKVANNVPRFVSGKFGAGVLIEEATTNLATGVSYGTYAYATSLGDVSLKNPHGRSTVQAYRVDSSGVASRGMKILPFVVGSTYTVSVVLKTEGVGSLLISANKAYPEVGNTISLDPKTLKTEDLGDGWVRFTQTYTVVSSTTTSLIFCFGVGSGAVGDLFYAYDLQWEQKGSGTSYTENPRAQDNMTIPTSALINDKGPWTIECWASSDDELARHRMIFSAWTKVYLAILGKVGVVLSWVDGVGAQQTKVYSMPTGTVGSLHHWAMTFDGGTVQVYLDGVLIITVPVTLPVPITSSPTFTFGNLTSSTLYALNGVISDFRVSNVVRSASELLGNFQSSSPSVVDRFTVLKMPLAGSFAPATPDYGAEFITKAASEVYEIPVDSTAGAFELNSSELNYDELAGAGVQQDRLTAIIRVGGVIIQTRPL